MEDHARTWLLLPSRRTAFVSLRRVRPTETLGNASDSRVPFDKEKLPDTTWYERIRARSSSSLASAAGAPKTVDIVS